MRRVRFREVTGPRPQSLCPSAPLPLSTWLPLYLALLSSSCVILGKSICLSEPIYLIYERVLIMFIYLTNCCGASQDGDVVNAKSLDMCCGQWHPNQIPVFPGLGSLRGWERSHCLQLGHSLMVSTSYWPPIAQSREEVVMSLLRASLTHTQ